MAQLTSFGLLLILGLLLIWGHVCDATKVWEREAEQRAARRRLKRSVAAWQRFRDQQEV